MQIDVGFGDKVDPLPTELPFPTLLPLDAAIVRAYPPEAVIAEKFQAMVVLGIANRDFFDIWTFASKQRFELPRLANSIRSTFEQRRTSLPEIPPVALTNEFLLDRAKQAQWNAFCKKLGSRDSPPLAEIGKVLVRFLMPAVEHVGKQTNEPSIWVPPGPWG
jgi:hypothetical protein